MPRDNDRDNRRSSGRRGPPSRGEGREQRGGRDERRGGGGFRKGGGDFKPREGRPGGPFRKERDGAPRGEGRDRTAGKRFGEKRSFGKSGGGFKKDGERAPRREDRPKREFRARDERGDRVPRNDAPRASYRKDGERPPRREFNRDGDRPPRRDFSRDERPRGGGFKRDDARGDFKRGESRSADRGPRSDFRRGERSDRGGDRAGARDGGKRFDRPRGDRPFVGKPRHGRPDAERPRFSRDRDDRTQGERPRQERPRTDRTPRKSHVWRDHPRNEGFEERDERNYEARPAFGGRGEYRERRPDRDGRRRELADAAPAKPKKAGDRIAKLMARAGLCSRRDAEEWIRQGRVSVNDRIITSPALDVTSQDKVLVDGAPLPERERTRLFLYHKPKGLVTTHADPEGRPTVFDSLPEGLPRLISIGRLDFNTEGLLLLTNDGGLARVLELPDTGWLRRYRVRAHGTIAQDKLDELRKGIEVDGVKYGPIEATLERDHGANVWILFAIREGKNREVRNVMAHLGLEVNRLIRVSYGPFQLGELAEGAVEEVRSRMLRDQLGERIAAAAGADFGLPTRESAGEVHGDEPGERPRKRAGLIADRKGRRVMVERSGRDSDGDDRPRRKPPAGYKGKRDRAPKQHES
ncbi:pseudouridine synthase [Bradyrhizobium sp. LHD-71]|uniref:pseudouridine synthase n=1 Tax=Bradyrhizobium sp. LHD-71 TaxID=3072141 RepID=UPI00280C7D13|nr:pseudouridine synthase [Bradyrhizobium sp. LHD-71]MDQ8726831.1 pseudouridine synthase [Bradyrhizobium sp. LHD-71]